ncbi:MAG: anaerobic sulfatase maturase [Desulfovibrio sp.]|jgi:uncharacterized protein|nr:anaerobic sulfatase maturase [Desulfovibrio sp.]
MRKSATMPLRPLAGYSGGAARQRFNVMVKPGGAACNLDCAYCYYLHKGKLFGQPASPRMADGVLEAFTRQYIESNEHDSIVFSWQGGEPTLLGLEFFEKALRFQKQYAAPGKTVANTLQTNGTLITGEWAAFLKRHGFLVGLSVDGPEDLHDMYRKDRAGRPTFARVMDGYEHLRRHGVPFTVLTTVNRHNARNPLDVYRFLTKELGADYIQFNPCAEPHSYRDAAPNFWPEESMPRSRKARARPGRKQSVVTEWSVDPVDWGAFLCAVFDEWREQDLGRVLVNWFETAVAQTMGLPAQICMTGEICGKGVVIEHTGQVFSCDHYVYPEYCLGNIREYDLAAMVFSERQKSFGFGKRDSLPRRCLHCPHGTLCWGQCPRHRFVKTPDGEPGLNYLCPGLRTFHAHTKSAIREIAAQCLAARHVA